MSQFHQSLIILVLADAMYTAIPKVQNHYKGHSELNRPQILLPEYWTDQQKAGYMELPHAQFMKPFCHRFPTGTLN